VPSLPPFSLTVGRLFFFFFSLPFPWRCQRDSLTFIVGKTEIAIPFALPPPLPPPAKQKLGSVRKFQHLFPELFPPSFPPRGISSKRSSPMYDLDGSEEIKSFPLFCDLLFFSPPSTLISVPAKRSERNSSANNNEVYPLLFPSPSLFSTKEDSPPPFFPLFPYKSVAVQRALDGEALKVHRTRFLVHSFPLPEAPLLSFSPLSFLPNRVSVQEQIS